MKKIFSIALLVSLLTISAFATTDTTTHEQLVEEYFEVSGQKETINTLPTQLTNMLEQQFAAAGENVDPKLFTVMVEDMTKKDSINKITENLEKLSSEDLTTLIAFYKTQTGKKCADMNRETDMDIQVEELQAFLQDLQTNPPSQHRIDSMNTMFQETITLTGSVKMVETMLHIFNAALPKEKQVSDENMTVMLEQMKEGLTQQLIVSFYFSLRDFSDSEIDEIVQFTLTPQGQAETDAQLAGITAYFTTVVNDIIDSIKQMTQDTTTKEDDIDEEMRKAIEAVS